MTSRAKPILKWAGGKSGLLRQLWPLFPRAFERYVEPFLGGAAVFLSLPKEGPALLNDVNEELVHLYSTVRDRPSDLMTTLTAFSQSYSEEFYYSLRARTDLTGAERAARTVFLNKAGFNGLYRQNSKAEFNVPFGKRARCPTLFDADNLAAVSRRFANATLTNFDFESVLEQSGGGDFVYCDPPYSPVSETASFTSYTGRGFGSEEQKRLRVACDAAVDRGAIVAVSNSWTPEMLALFEGWNVHEIQARRAINSKGDRRGKVAELLAIRGLR